MANILLVEDERNLGLLYESEFGTDGHQVTIARDAREALQAVDQSRPDLVIVDIRLGEPMDGIELMSQLLEQDENLPVIINTGYSQYRQNFMTWGAEAYVVKSSDLSPLKQAVANALQKRAGLSSAQGQH